MVNSVTTGPLRATIQLNWPFQGNHNVDMVLSEKEFDIPVVEKSVAVRGPDT